MASNSDIRIQTLTIIGTVLSYSMPDTAVEGEAFSVTGQLYKEGSGEVIPNARIDIYIAGELITYDLTNALGQYAFNIVITEDGEYDILISYAGGTCTSGCITSCTSGCIESCVVSCIVSCTVGCVASCIASCTRSCIASCTAPCTASCTASCIASCVVSCTVGCISGCIASCIVSCVVGCIESFT
ncbi:hypothetical protein LCGC14_0815900 [marine sediment metagenome]|uniref:Uncharacterized protein n=1 Tax=marine sediment metagenome TaxID=412755 RepID=A0A0F9PK82_9ZZZZ